MLYLHLRWCFLKRLSCSYINLLVLAKFSHHLYGFHSGKTTAYDQNITNKFLARYWEGARLALHVDRLSTHVLSAILCLAKVYDYDDVPSFIPFFAKL